MDEAGIVIAAFMGISLAAASGFRVFLPPFLMSLAVKVNLIDFDLVGSQFGPKMLKMQRFSRNWTANLQRGLGWKKEAFEHKDVIRKDKEMSGQD